MTTSYFLRLFRCIFVLFSLFLLGDAFYRWDGFSYYASFYDFVPAVALAFIQWTIISLVFTIVVWSVIRLIHFLFSLLGSPVSLDSLSMFTGVFVVLGAAAFFIKKIALPSIQTTLIVKVAVLVLLPLISLIVTRIFSNKSSSYQQILQERITPLVWLFGAFLIVSFPLVAYHTWMKGPDSTETEMIADLPAEKRERPNIILVTFDALSARDMSVYGYHRNTTPFISRWAENASIFSRAISESTFTTPTTASMMTGKRLWSHLTYYQGSSIQKKKDENIARELKRHGYKTMAYIENSNGSPVTLAIDSYFDKISFMPEARGFLDGYHGVMSLLFHGRIRLYGWITLDDFYPAVMFKKYLYDPVLMPVYTQLYPEEKDSFSRGYTVLDKFISDMDKESPAGPFFAWIHLYPPHSPYVPPVSFQGHFDSSDNLRGYLEQNDIIADIKVRLRKDKVFSKSDLKVMETLRSRYNEHILYCDKEFEEFIGEFESRDFSGNSIVMLSADHGEIFEHNSIMHGETPYEPVVHIPLIIKEPGQDNGTRIDGVVEQVDISATILDYSGIPVPQWMDGRSLRPMLRGNSLPQRPAFAMHLQRSRNRTITRGFLSLYQGDYKLVYFIEKDRALLFNLKEDPNEMVDLFEKETETGQFLLTVLKEHIDKANKRIEGEMRDESR